jgi:arylsulfatase A-like enzyme
MIADRFASGVGRPWAAVAVLAVVLGPAGHATAAAKPNFVVIVADDMGFSDAGCYGGEIATPHLDRLADGGLRWTQFYNTSRCWPTRASLLTKYYPQQVRRDAVPGVVSGARGVRPAWAKLLPDRLRQLGYRSYHSGKWHFDGQPTRNGFDRSYRLDDHDRHFNPKTHFEDDQPLPVVGFDDDYYSSTAIADHAIRFLRQHEKEHRDRPFLCIGPGWSSLANTPFRRHKTWVHEGGISTPLIAHWPAGISARGQLRHTPGHVIDLAPTILELAGAPAGSGRDRGAPALPGRSLAPVVTADNDLPRDPLWWAHEGHRGLRAGRWKIVAAGRSAGPRRPCRRRPIPVEQRELVKPVPLERPGRHAGGGARQTGRLCSESS